MPNEKWFLKRLYEEIDQPTLRFAFQGTINWMRGLALVSDKELTDKKIKKFYKNVKKRKENKKADLLVFENIMIAMQNFHSIKIVNEKIENPYDVVRMQIVSWYYTMYYASSAMIAASSGNKQETHTSTAKTWQKELIVKGLVMTPFNLSLGTLVEKDVKKSMSTLRNGNKNDLNMYPSNQSEAYGCLYSYLQGTASYKKWQTEEELQKSKEFKELGVSDFRKKVARELRDKRLEKGNVNFLVQAFRYRGKAHYRDSVFLSYGDSRSEEL